MKKEIWVIIGIVSLVLFIVKLIRSNQKVWAECKSPDGDARDFCGKRSVVNAYVKYFSSPVTDGYNQGNDIGSTCNITPWNDSWAQDPDS